MRGYLPKFLYSTHCEACTEKVASGKVYKVKRHPENKDFFDVLAKHRGHKYFDMCMVEINDDLKSIINQPKCNCNLFCPLHGTRGGKE